MKHDPTKRTEIYHKRSRVFQNQEAILDGKTRRYNGREIRWTGSEENKKLIRRFQQALFAKPGTNSYRVGKLTACLRLIVDLLDQDLSTLTKHDAEAFLARVNKREEWSPHTKRDYIRNFKQFCLWYEEEDPRLQNGDEKRREEARAFYRYVRKISTAHPRKTLDYASTITEEDLLLLLEKGCQTALERALVAFLHESGARVGELLGIRLRDIERKGQYALVRVDGKTGERRIPVMQSLPYIEQWLRHHPARETPEALLWVSTHNGHYAEPLRHIGVTRLLRRVMAASGVGKRCNPHWFRHSRATILGARGEGEAILCKHFGWEIGSKQVRTYVHLGAKQVEDAFLRRHGLQAQTIEEIKTMHCFCGANNEDGSRYCHACGHALSIEILESDEVQKSAAIEESMKDYADIMRDPARSARFLAFYQAFLKEQGGG